MLRLFVTSNQISTVFCSTIAKKTHKQGDIDFLLIDNFLKKESLIELIHASSKIHSWNGTIDFSKRISDNYNLKPTLWKRFSRSVKHLPVISSFYKSSVSLYSKNKGNKDAKMIFDKINAHTPINPDMEVELFLLTQTELNTGLISYFNKPVVNYYEHGLVDYIYVLKKENVNKFYVIFEDTYGKFVEKHSIVKIDAPGYFDHDDMVIGFPAPKINMDLSINGAYSKYALILLDSSEIFNVPKEFWIKFLEKCISEIKNFEEHSVIIKPHPGQSNETLALIKDFCKDKPNIVLLSDPLQISMSVESIYIANKDQVDYVFSTYSAAEFYLAKFFGGHTQFCFLYEFIRPYYMRGPKQYADAFVELEPYINEVFYTKACKFLN